MNEFTLTPDDPKLTAYALGELEGDERATMEAALRRDPAARAAVEEIRAVAAQLAAALAAEEDPETVAEIVPFPSIAGEKRDDEYRSNGRAPMRKIVRLPQVYYIIGGLAAACLAVLVALRGPQPAHTVEHPRSITLSFPPREMVTPLQLPTASSSTLSIDATSFGAGDTASSRNDGSIANRGPLDPRVTPLLDQTKPFSETSKETDRGRQLDPEASSKPVTFSTDPAPLFVPGAPAQNETAPNGNALGQERRDAELPRPPALPLAAGQNPGLPNSERLVFRVPPVPAVAPDNAPKAIDSTVAVQPKAGSAPTAPPPVDNDLVKLDTVVVSADPLNFDFAAGMLRAANSGVRDPKLLSPPPHGARFGRNAENFDYTPDNDFVGATQNPISTYVMNVDTASYADVRRSIERGMLPSRSAVRIEELLNYFPYRYPAPKSDTPFAAALEVSAAPWSLTHRLVRIGLKGREFGNADRPPANLVFLVDLSSAMGASNRLPLIRDALRLFIDKLRPDDRIAIVACGANSRIALPSTLVAKATNLLAVLDSLIPGGPGNGETGFQIAYDAAQAGFAERGINRVIVCLAADFNLGSSSESELARMVEERAKSGVSLTVFGFGAGNRKDAILEKLAARGSGMYGFIDTPREAEKLLLAQVNGPAKAIAKEVEIRVEFNPARVSSYRLIGYENRWLRKEDFNNDKVDAGEIGAGHTTTALYEIVPVGAEQKRGGTAPVIDGLKYQRQAMAKPGLAWGATEPPPPSKELLTVEVRYKKPDDWIVSRKAEFALTDPGRQFADASADFKFAAAVAEFGMILRESPHRGTGSMGDVVTWAAAGATHAGDDPHGYRREFLGLARRAQTLLR